MARGKHHALARDLILRILTAYVGTTTTDGADDGSTLEDSNLATKPDYDGHWVLIVSGPYIGQSTDIVGATTGGTVNAHENFDGQITKGTGFVILATKALPAEVAAIEAKLDKLAGATPVADTTNAKWNAAEANVVSLGANDTKYKLHSLLVSIHNLVGTVITVRMHMQVKGTERKVYEQLFDATSDPPGLWIVNGTIGIHEVLRVTLESNNAADDDKDVDYDYMLEEM